MGDCGNFDEKRLEAVDEETVPAIELTIKDEVALVGVISGTQAMQFFLSGWFKL